MVQGGFGSIVTTVGEAGDPTYGCIVPKTYISIVVVVLAAVVGGALVGMFSYWILLLIRLGANSLPFSKKRSKKSALRPVPSDLVSWMLHATRESTFGQQQREYGRVNLAGVPEDDKQTREWVYKVMDDGAEESYAKLAKAKGAPLTTPPQQAISPGYTPYEQTGIHWDPKSGTQFGSHVPLVSQNGRGYSP